MARNYALSNAGLIRRANMLKPKVGDLVRLDDVP